MIFTEVRFLVFFVVVFAIHWLLRKNLLRKIWLLICSYAFYCAWDWRFLSLILISTMVDFVAGAALGRKTGADGKEAPPAFRKFWLCFSLVCNLGLLGVFKYFHFFADSAVALLDLLGIPVSAPTLHVILPVGISFYTFQTLSYTIEIYLGKLKPIRNPLDFALFVGFFPQLVAGPIVRASEFLPQLTKIRRLVDVNFRYCLALFLIGYIKKACMADHIAQFIDPIYADPSAYDPHAIWQGYFLYAVQIYCDFSGYSDMAIALAGMLGYTLPLNFDYPLFSFSITEFWQRWHLTLSTWFRDFLYIPLGGSRRGTRRTYINLMIVFVLCGLWHGGSWKFAIWGVVHGLFLITERLMGVGRGSSRRSLLKLIYFNFALSLTWPLFRGESLTGAIELYKGMFGFGTAPFHFETIHWVWWIVMAGFYAVHLFMFRMFNRENLESLSDRNFALLLGALTALALLFSAAHYQPFIYFQF